MFVVLSAEFNIGAIFSRNCSLEAVSPGYLRCPILSFFENIITLSCCLTGDSEEPEQRV